MDELTNLDKKIRQNLKQKKVIFVVGPTASGKSAWALEQARKYHGSIVNIDSVQFYKGLEVGAASPTSAEQKQVPHYLYSYVSAPHEMTAGQYLKDFYELLKADILFPLFIVGGTGFYIQALEKGMFDVVPIPEGIREEIELELKVKGPQSLFEELKQKDPNSAIHINDHYRLVRAIEIIRHTGKIPSQMHNTPEKNKYEFPFQYKKIGFNLSKEDFLKKVELRTSLMVKNGIIEETHYFLKNSFESWAPLSSVGFKQTVEYIKTNKNLDWLNEQINQSTMQLIKKQKTWFKRDQSILWSDQFNHSADVNTKINQELDHFLFES